MTGLLPDVNFQGHFDRLLDVLKSDEWREYWDAPNLRCHTFAEVGLAHDTQDREVFELCHRSGWVFLTGNRNHDGPDSLEAAIRHAGQTALPVITLGTADDILRSGAFARQVAVGLIEYLQDMQADPAEFYGTGRLYLPKSNT